ncbi:DUF551 domain-containing protein [Klebsiella pneumoniae]|uniref:DUF551 domain-containing protein n=1 Tax=Klebsiella pneumoniae TaxID=573 RepID=UPI0028BD854C|nr:DUF551 domain-containing protein [Klebsiella pneumoniae]
MDSESGCLPLDYLQGHKDGLEWAAQLTEANHPETGDWLYDDPIELAKAIRKGPDMPPAQPAADSEPVAIIDQANLDYLRSGADADVWPPEREEMGDVLLYRHAQPAPVVPENCVTAEHRRVIEMLLSVCGAAFELADDSCQQDVDGEDCHVVPDDAFQKLSDALDEIENTLPTEDIDRPDVFLAWSAMPRAALKSILQPGNSPVIPDGWKMVPIDATRAMIDAARRVEEDGYDAMHKAMLAAAPQLPGSEPATVPGKWIPVSEHLPKEKGVYQVWNGKYVDNVPFWFGSFQSLHSELITHWMPLPAAPQEVK